MTPPIPSDRTTQRLPTGIWILGFVSLFMDISSEMIHSLLPLFMVTILGTSITAVGIVEGLAESLALTVKVFSGALSDYLGRRKALAAFGYALGAMTKPLFPWPPALVSSSRRVYWTGSAKAFAARPEMRWWPTLLRSTSAVRPSVCGRLWIPSGPSSVHCRRPV